MTDENPLLVWDFKVTHTRFRRSKTSISIVIITRVKFSRLMSKLT